MDIKAYWNSVLRQDANAMRSFFCADAQICWHNTNERFSFEGFIRANCEYPGNWEGELLRNQTAGELLITVMRIWDSEKTMSFHVVSFIKLSNDKIISIDEYWGDDGPPPEWRQNLGLSEEIKGDFIS